MKKVIFPTGELPKLDATGKLHIPEYRAFLDVLKLGYKINAQEYFYLFWYYTDKTECEDENLLDLFFRAYCKSNTTAWRIQTSLKRKGVEI